MPVLGSGVLGVPVNVFVSALKKAVAELDIDRSSLEKINICEFN